MVTETTERVSDDMLTANGILALWCMAGRHHAVAAALDARSDAVAVALVMAARGRSLAETADLLGIEPEELAAAVAQNGRIGAS